MTHNLPTQHPIKIDRYGTLYVSCTSPLECEISAPDVLDIDGSLHVVSAKLLRDPQRDAPWTISDFEIQGNHLHTQAGINGRTLAQFARGGERAAPTVAEHVKQLVVKAVNEIPLQVFIDSARRTITATCNEAIEGEQAQIKESQDRVARMGERRDCQLSQLDQLEAGLAS
jgi:hypothetical protein